MKKKAKNKSGEVKLWKILEREASNKNAIYFYQRKFFWKVYDRSLFHLHLLFGEEIIVFRKIIISEKTVNSKKIKTEKEVFFGGISCLEMKQYIEKLKRQNLETSFSHWGLQASTVATKEEDFKKWKETVRSTSQQNMNLFDLIRKIEKFPLEKKNPLECLKFLINLKSALNYLGFSSYGEI